MLTFLLESDHKKEMSNCQLFYFMRAYVWLLYDKMNLTIMERVLHFILDFVNACRFSKNISGYTSGTLFNSTDMVIEENYSHESQYNLFDRGNLFLCF